MYCLSLYVYVWEYTLCPNEYPTASPYGATLRLAKKDLGKYTFYYSQYETDELSARYDNYIFSITFNWQKITNVCSDNEGIISVYFPAGGELEVEGYFME